MTIVRSRQMLKVKRILRIGSCAILIILLITGCKRKTLELISNYAICEGILGGKTYSDSGIISYERGIANYLDFETGITMPMCTKLNCVHEGRNLYNLIPMCNAYLGERAHCAAVIGDSLYYVTVPDDGDYRIKEFYKAKPDGTDRELLYKKEETEIFNYGAYENEFMIYIYYNQTDSMGIELKKHKMGIYLLNLKNNNMISIPINDEFGGKVLVATVKDNVLYYMKTYFTENINDVNYGYLSTEEGLEYIESIRRTEIWGYDLESGEDELIDVCETGNSTYMLGYGYLLSGYNDNATMTLLELGTDKAYNVKGDGLKNSNICLSDGGVFFCNDGVINFWRYGSAEIENIGSFKEKIKSFVFSGSRRIIGVMEKDGEYKRFYCLKEDLLNGTLNYKIIDVR